MVHGVHLEDLIQIQEIREVDNQEIRIKMDSNLEDPLIEIKEDKIMKETEIIHVLT